MARSRAEQYSQVAAAQVPKATAPKPLGPKLAIDFGRYHALVIGNNNYVRVRKLETALSDAVAVSEALKRLYGFEVELLLDATRYDILKSLSKLRARLTERDNLLIYYAGHGVIDNETNEGYWLPVDAEPDIVANWISTATLTTMVKAMSARHVIMVADSCYSGTLVRTAPANLRTGAERSAWLERMSRKRSRTAITSGGLEPVMDRGGGDNSVFAKAFLDALYENSEVVDAQSLFATIQRRVVVNSDQTPEYADIRGAGHDGGDFLFVRR
ncbi:MAG: caspase domain-containing protein [Kiloniellales bacterium]